MHFTQSVIDNLKVYLILQMLWIWMSDRMWCGYQCQCKYLCIHDYCSRKQELRHIYGKEWWWLLFFYCWLRLLLLFLATFRFRSRLPEAAGVHEPVNNTETRVQLRSFQSWWWWGWWWGGGGGWWGWWWWGWRIIMINSVCRVVHLRLSTRNSLDGHLLNLATISPIYLYEVFRVLDVMKQICTFSSMKLQSLPILSKCLSFAVFFAQNCPYSAC